MQLTLSDRHISYFRLLCIAVLLLSAASFVVSTLHWPWTWDTQVMHYISYLLDHGKVPYKDIYDINMPGSYLTERWAIDIFGGGDIGWRLYEYTLLAAMTAAMIVIARPYDWLAGLFAGVMFTLFHGSDGAMDAVERDEVMMVLIFVGYAFLFEAVRRRRPAWMACFGLALGIASLIKPTVAPLALVLLLAPVLVFRKSETSPAPYLLWGCGGLALALGILLEFLLPQHAFGPFLFILGKLVPYYSSLAHPSLSVLVRRSLPETFRIYVPIALILILANRHRVTWEMWAIRLGFVFGAASYFVQQKGYDYHRYTYLAFGLLWIGLEFTGAMKERGWRRTLGFAGMAFAVLLMVPFNALKIHRRHEANPFSDQLERDLIQAGATHGNPAFQGRIQCLDLVTGCLRALYRLDLLQSTGFTGDLQFFAPDDGKVVPYYRQIFLTDIQREPPKIIVLANEWYSTSGFSFDKLNAWPAFRDYLTSAYDLAVTREIAGTPFAYRIYVLRGASLDNSQHPKKLSP